MSPLRNRYNRFAGRGWSLMEMLVVITIIGILIAIAVPNYARIKADVKKKACIANMGTLQNATRLFYMENLKDSSFKGVDVETLMKNNYLKTEPVCPNATGLTKSQAFYAIMDEPGKKIDIICVNKFNADLAHGSLEKMISPRPQPQQP